MQIMLIAIFFIFLIAYIIYKVNNKFEIKELTILFFIIVLLSILSYMFLEDKKHEVPELFKEKYEKVNNVKIEKFSFERLNNKMVSSKTNFIYNFDYIVKKENKEYICNVKNVKIKKIEDEFIFENFNSLNEKCIQK
ncbi:hypothetical protein CP965_12630 [Halarcobacter mediterraneus]|uniref:Uncharacterized protein n=1 Tax=Halarcobacter mediterraneus TaxID=2023153 RepID=A0A4Q1AUY1_9BACT|nr:hypothetical protein CP965_12630 [Halarcobacter mediterraneus]